MRKKRLLVLVTISFVFTLFSSNINIVAPSSNTQQIESSRINVKNSIKSSTVDVVLDATMHMKPLGKAELNTNYTITFQSSGRLIASVHSWKHDGNVICLDTLSGYAFSFSDTGSTMRNFKMIIDKLLEQYVSSEENDSQIQPKYYMQYTNTKTTKEGFLVKSLDGGFAFV